jgi:preprotein translocase subunit SecG
MFNTIIIIAIIISLLLMLIVLIQNPKGGGLSSEFGGSSTGQMFGVKKTTDLLEQLTWGFAAVILVLSLASRFMLDSSNVGGGLNSVNAEKAATKTLPSAPATAPAATPSAPATAPAAAPSK